MNRARARYARKHNETPTPTIVLPPSRDPDLAIPPHPIPLPLPCTTARENDLPDCYTEESPLIIDNTILSTFATCPTRAVTSYHHHLTSNEDSNALLVGSATHKALELFFKGSSPKEAMKVFQELYYATGDLIAPEENLSWENTSATVESWLASHALDSLSFVPIPGMIEGAITAPLWPERWGKRVLYLGLVDLLVQDRATGLLSILDHKTTSRRLDDNWTQQFRISSQLSGYIWLAQANAFHERLDKYEPIQSAYINTIGFSRLPVSDRKCVKHSVAYSVCRGMHATFRLDGPFQRSPLALNQWLNNARQLAKKWAWTREDQGSLSQLRDVEKPGMFQYEACRYCPFTDFCSGLIADPIRLPEFYRRAEWTPWKTNGKENLQ